jgi:hypothetical protein
MDKSILCYVIISETDGQINYLSVSNEGYYWSIFHGNAMQFNTIAEAQKFLSTDKYLNEPRPSSNGTIHPPTLIQEISKFDETNTKGSCVITISQLSLQTCFNKKIDCEIKKPTGYIYN